MIKDFVTYDLTDVNLNKSTMEKPVVPEQLDEWAAALKIHLDDRTETNDIFRTSKACNAAEIATADNYGTNIEATLGVVYSYKSGCD